MLVLLSFGLVLVATVLLVLGLLTDGGLTFIYISIGLSVVAAVVLVIAVRLTKPRDAAPVAPAPLLETDDQELVTVGAPTATVTASAPPTAAVATTPAAATAGDSGEWEASAEEEWESGDDWDEPEFPIAEYDDLKVSEIVPLLPQLYSDELDVVEARERAGKARATILTQISALRLKGGAAADLSVATVAAAVPAEDEWEVDDEETWEEPAAEVEAEVEEEDVPVAEVVDDLAGVGDEVDDDFFPIEDYDILSASEIVGVLGELDDDELQMVRDREVSTRNRRTILNNIDRRLGGEAPAPPPPPPPVKKAPARKPAPPAPTPVAKRAPAAKKAAAPAPAAKKPVAAAKKAPAAPAKKASAPVKTAAAPAKKAAAPAKKAAAPAKKAAATTAAKKAPAPAKKAPAKKR